MVASPLQRWRSSAVLVAMGLVRINRVVGHGPRFKLVEIHWLADEGFIIGLTDTNRMIIVFLL